MSEYIYFVTGLPDITLDETRTFPLSLDYFDEVAGRLEAADRELMAIVRHPFDNTNLIRAMEGKSDSFDPRGAFPSDEIANLLRGTESGPDYMDTFLKAKKEGRALFQGLGDEDSLAWLFLEEMEAHPNAFLREWFAFDADVRNLLAGLSARSLGTDPGRVSIGSGGVAEAVAKSSAADFGLAWSHPWAEKILAAKGLLARDKAADQVRWDKLDEMRTFAHFDVAALLAYAQQLFIAERWLKMDPAEGRAMLESLSKGLIDGAKALMLRDVDSSKQGNESN
jgi:hypothetical protein